MRLVVIGASLPSGAPGVGLAAETWSRTLLHYFFFAWALLTVFVLALVVWRLLPPPSKLGRRYTASRRWLTLRLAIALLLASPILLVATITPYAEAHRTTGRTSSPLSLDGPETVYCFRVVKWYWPRRLREGKQYTSRLAWELIIPTVVLMYAGLWWLITYKSQSVGLLLRRLLRPDEGQSARDGPPLSRRNAANTLPRDETSKCEIPPGDPRASAAPNRPDDANEEAVPPADSPAPSQAGNKSAEEDLGVALAAVGRAVVHRLKASFETYESGGEWLLRFLLPMGLVLVSAMMGLWAALGLLIQLTCLPLSLQSVPAALLGVVALLSPVWAWLLAGPSLKEQFYREVFLLLALLSVPLLLWSAFGEGLPVAAVVVLVYPLLLWLGATRMSRLTSGDFVVMALELIAAAAFGAACVAATSHAIAEPLIISAAYSPIILCFAGALGGFRKRGNLGVAVANVLLQGIYVFLIRAV